MLTHRSPPVELLPPASLPGGGVVIGSDFLIDVTFPNICKRMTNPMYATENNRIVFGDMVHPSASSLKNDKLLALCPIGYPPPRGLRPFDLCAAIFLAKSFLSY